MTKQMRTHLRALVPEVEDATELNANLQAQIQIYSDSDEDFFMKTMILIQKVQANDNK